MRLKKAKLYKLKLPFQASYKHALKARNTSESILLKLVTDTGTIGYGECLSRD